MKKKKIYFLIILVLLLLSTFLYNKLTESNKTEDNKKVKIELVQLNVDQIGKKYYEYSNEQDSKKNTSPTVSVEWNTTAHPEIEPPESVTIQLTSDEEIVEEWELSESNNWSTSLDKISNVDENEEYSLQITSSNDGDLDNFFGRFIIQNDRNLNIELRAVFAGDMEVVTSKNWDDDENNLGKRPDSATFNIIETATGTISETFTITEEDSWTYYTYLPVINNDDGTSGYTIEEVNQSIFYTPSIVENYESNGAVARGLRPSTLYFNVTNTFAIPDETVSIGITKNWDDNNDAAGKRPESVTLELLADGEKIQDVELTAADNWYRVVTDLPKYNDQANEIVYSLSENSSLSFYEVAQIAPVNSEIPEEDMETDISLSITNKFVVPSEEIRVIVSKIWDDNENAAGKRPESLTLQLLADGVKIQDVELTESNNWEETISSLPKYNDKADEIIYSLEEENVPKFYEQVNINPYYVGDSKYEISELTITNTFVVPETKVSVSVEKIWDDNDNYASKRPESIIVELLQNGVVYKTQEITSSNNWEYTFENLPEYDENADKYTYTVKERDKIQFYETAISGTSSSGFKITNKFVVPSEETSVIVSKIWDDNNDAAGKRPDSLTLQLLADGVKIQDVELTESNNWEETISSLPKYNDKADEIIYSLEEENVPKFYEQVNINPYYVGDSKYEISELTITNTFVVPETKVSVSVEKIWDDNDNYASKRPESIIVELLQNGVVYKTQEITSSNNWEYTFENLPEYDEKANKYVYTIQEKDIIQFYETTISETSSNSFKITNKFVVPEEKINIEVLKKWNDNDNVASKRPDNITLTLYGDAIKIQDINLTSNNNWKTQIKDLPKYNDKANEVTYTIEESEVPKYYELENISMTESSSESIDFNFEITNKFYSPDTKKSILVEKIWDDNNNYASKRPESITVDLFQNGVLYKTQEITSSNNWEYTFENIPEYDEKANKYIYTIQEKDTIQFYETTISKPSENNFKITNKFVVPNEKIAIPIKKIWKDNNNIANKRPNEIVIELKADNVILEEITLSSTTNWEYTFNNLPKYNDKANEIAYTIDEKETPTFYSKEINNYEITNTFYVPNDTIEITAQKIWDDNNNEAQKRPSSITLQIKDSNGVVKEQVVNASNNWEFTFTNLPKYDSFANEISYSVDEKETIDYYVKNIVGNKITNKFVVPDDKITIPVKKEWDDMNNKNNTRPETVTIQVKDEDGKVVSEALLSENNNWQYEFEIPKYNNKAEEIKYSIDEKEVSNGYTKLITDYSIKNQLKMVKIETNVTCHGGTITGSEKIYYGGSSTPENIIINANDGYRIDYIEINGSKIAFDEYYNLVLNNYETLREDIVIDVCFTDEDALGKSETIETPPSEKNPDTSDYKIIIIFIIVSILIIVRKNSKKHLEFIN